MKHVVKPVVVWANLGKLQHSAKAGTLMIYLADWAWQQPETGWESEVIEVSKGMVVMPMVETLPTLHFVGLQGLLKSLTNHPLNHPLSSDMDP